VILDVAALWQAKLATLPIRKEARSIDYAALRLHNLVVLIHYKFERPLPVLANSACLFVSLSADNMAAHEPILPLNSPLFLSSTAASCLCKLSRIAEPADAEGPRVWSFGNFPHHSIHGLITLGFLDPVYTKVLGDKSDFATRAIFERPFVTKPSLPVAKYTTVIDRNSASELT
jgi:hypothetical protein